MSVNSPIPYIILLLHVTTVNVKLLLVGYNTFKRLKFEPHFKKITIACALNQSSAVKGSKFLQEIITTDFVKLHYVDLFLYLIYKESIRRGKLTFTIINSFY